MELPNNIYKAIRTIAFSTNYVLLPNIHQNNNQSQLFSTPTSSPPNSCINYYLHENNYIRYIEIPKTDNNLPLIKLKFLNIMSRFISDYLPVNDEDIYWDALFDKSQSHLENMIDFIKAREYKNYYYYKATQANSTYTKCKYNEQYKNIKKTFFKELNKLTNNQKNISIILSNHIQQTNLDSFKIQQFSYSESSEIKLKPSLFKFQFYNEKDINFIVNNSKLHPKAIKKGWENLKGIFTTTYEQYLSDEIKREQLTLKPKKSATIDISYSVLHNNLPIYFHTVDIQYKDIVPDIIIKFYKTHNKLTDLFAIFNDNPNHKDNIKNGNNYKAIKGRYDELKKFIDQKYDIFDKKSPWPTGEKGRSKHLRAPLLLTEEQYTKLKSIKEYWLEENHLEIELLSGNKFKKLNPISNDQRRVKAILIHSKKDIRWVVWKPILPQDDILTIHNRFLLLKQINYFPDYLFPFYIGNKENPHPRLFNNSILWEFYHFKNKELWAYPQISTKTGVPSLSHTNKKFSYIPSNNSQYTSTIPVTAVPKNKYDIQPGTYNPHVAVHKFLYTNFKKTAKTKNIILTAIRSPDPYDIIDLFHTYLSFNNHYLKGGSEPNFKIKRQNIKSNIINHIINNLNLSLYKSLNSGLLSYQFESFQNYIEYIIMSTNRNPIYIIDLIARIYSINIVLFNVNYNYSNQMNISCFAYHNYQNTMLIQVDENKALALICPKIGSKKKHTIFHHFNNNNITKVTGFKIDDAYIKRNCKSDLQKFNNLNAWKPIPILQHLRDHIPIGTNFVIEYYIVDHNTNFVNAILIAPKNNKTQFLYIPVQFYKKTYNSKHKIAELRPDGNCYYQTKLIKLFSCDDTIRHYNTISNKHHLLEGLKIRFKFKNYLLLESGEFVPTHTQCNTTAHSQKEDNYIKASFTIPNKTPPYKTINIKYSNLDKTTIKKFILNEHNKQYISYIDHDNNHHKLDNTFHILQPATTNYYKFADYPNYKIPLPHIYQSNISIQNVTNTPIVNYDALLQLLPKQEAWNAHTAEIDFNISIK